MVITNFNAGELSEYLSGRYDLQQYYSGARRINNFDVLPTGGIRRRSGWRNCGELHGDSRLIPFIVNRDISFILELLPEPVAEGETPQKGRMYIWKNGTPVLDEDDQQVYMDIPYNSMSFINDVQYAQNYNEIVFVHKDYTPIKLIYNSDTSFTIGEMNFNFYPSVNLDDDYNYIIIAQDELPLVVVIDNIPYVNGVAYYSGAYCILNSLLYKYNVTLERWELQSNDPDIDTEIFTVEGKHPGAVAYYNNRLFFASSRNEPQKVWASATPDTRGNRYNNFATYQKYITVNKVLKDQEIHIFSGTISTSDIDYRANTTIIRNVTQDLTGIDDITRFYLSNSVFPIGTKVLSVTRDTIKVDQRADITEDSQTLSFTIQLWKNNQMATEEDYEVMIIENNITTNDCSFNFELGSSENDAIKWLASNNNLVIGTETSIWGCPSSVSALNISVIMNGKYGSDDVQALSIDTAVVYFAQGRRGIREHYLGDNKGAFVTNNIALSAEHILRESPARDFDYATNPYNRLIIVREDGLIVTLLYDKVNGIMAWNRIEHGSGKFRSCAVVRGDSQNDIVYTVVDTDGRYTLESYDSNDDVYLDSWQVYDSEKEYNLPGAILYNMTTHEESSLEDIPEDYIHDNDRVYIGYKYVSDIISMPVMLNDPTGKKRITSLMIRFLNSYFPILKVDDLEDEVFSDTEPFTGIKKITYPGKSDYDVTFRLTTDKPEQTNILVINAQAV